MWKQYNYIVFLFCTFNVFAQQQEVLGIIKSTADETVPFANIIVYDNADASKPLTYGYSNEQGQFVLKITKGIREITLNITAIGFEEKTVFFQLNGQPLEIRLKESVTQLKEVVIEAQRATDTLNIGFYDMNLSKGSTLREILNKTDGILIGEESGISFQGKPINKILINGKEVFVNQNKIALDNLNYEIMEDVQIINNYKDKFTIDFNRIRDPVINIETKEEFRGVFKAQVDAGTGYDKKHILNGKGFFFSDKLNAFITTNTNNTGEKELGQKDVNSSISKYATEVLSNTLRPFFVEDDRTQKNFVSNSSLITRWQGRNSKTGLVFYHGNMQTERTIEYSTFIADTLAQKRSIKNAEKGNFISATADQSRILSQKTVLQNVLSTMVMYRQSHNGSTNALYIPDINTFTEQNQNKPKNFTISNALQLTRLLSDNTAFDLNLDYYNEKNTKDFETQLTSIDTLDIFQEETTSKHLFSALVNIRHRLNSASLNTGVELTKNLEEGNLKFRGNTHEYTNLKRDIVTVGIPLTLTGRIKKLDYTFLVTPTLIHTQKSDNRHFLKMFHSFTYNFEQQNNLNISMNHSYRFYNLNVLFDTIIETYNQIIINDRENIDQYSTNNEISVSWFNNNVARSKSNHFVYRYNREQDFLQSVLDSISNNIFYYSNRIFDKKETHSISSGYRKGFYLGKAYHLFNIGGGFDYTSNNYSSAVDDRPAQAKSNSWNPSLNLDFLPRNFFVKEITNKVNWNHLAFWLDDKKINSQSVITNTFTVKGHGDKTTWNVNFIYNQYNIEQGKFSVPDFHFFYKYDVSDTLSFSLVGQSLLTLLNLNNYNFVNTLSDGNTITQTRTTNNLGYFVLCASLKF